MALCYPLPVLRLGIERSSHEADPCVYHWDCGPGLVCVTNEVDVTGCDYACDFDEAIAKCPEGRYCSFKPGLIDFGLCSKTIIPD